MSRTDSDIRTDILHHLEGDERVDASGIRVDVSRGHVLLSGIVPDFPARISAEDDAWMVSGVQEVVNTIEVQLATLTGLPPDPELQKRVEHIIHWNGAIDSSNLEVKVFRGWVTLRGTVPAYWQKVRAEDLVTGVYGVVGITNNLAVVPTRSALDREIARNIEAALKRNVIIDEKLITVEVENGAVTLSGTVSSKAEARAARDISRNTRGVVSVEDRMNVKYPSLSFSSR